MRQNKRVQELKKVTSNNINMFLRIQAQTSHYQIKGMHRQMSCQALPPRPPSHTKSDSNHINDAIRMRCQSAKTTLLSRCTTLKQSMARHKEELKT